MGQLDGKAGLITGAASGIGAATARVLAREGAKLLLTDLDDAALQKLGGLHPGVTKFVKPVPYAQMLRLIRVYMDISKSH